jgi:hypothetical protein
MILISGMPVPSQVCIEHFAEVRAVALASKPQPLADNYEIDWSTGGVNAGRPNTRASTANLKLWS